MKDYRSLPFDYFLVVQQSTNKYYFFASSINRIILVFEKNGTLGKIIKTNTHIIEMKKISHNIVILT
jgi:hypothetical protein